MKINYKLHYSFRRFLVDQALEKIKPALNGVILDLGGKKNKKRGRFRPPSGPQISQWVYANKDTNEEPHVVLDGEKLAFPNASFNWVICTEVLEYVDNPTRLMNEVYRVLNHGGRLVLTAPFLFRIHGHDHDLQRLTETKLKSVLTQAGFGDMTIESQGYYFTVLADFIKMAIAQISSKPIRYLVALFLLPLVLLLAMVDQLSAVAKSEFLSSFTTGYFVVAKKL
ncbi:MAG: hypothetical protein COV74_09320 [Candidatus Omnitrophica bacterium CG11_big_fil_rev_8_21_14_0_20_45_26]|uniref:Methyltransferase type 11 domain-containing protein n=1 Tax=Candidatus Abzuiibacterium crystallinum TaxID=1974748 RepID=A0A2H0LLW9_9BACT|nr:MAG: hypothetical protein COV74_09320 [Candidatus Omnitrophica bacterium CG11_big_fil_rev_8_21_14_0_20_45_26]PIW63271.1 MAG: hypothetical protein COW12_11295 [Candidatus Omnitrophica bacterium CG12_big_fil_rev_8_21_14_0_65_45_16]